MTKKVRDAFGFIVRRPQWITLSSRPVRLSVKSLPEQVRLVGDFKLRVDAAPRVVERGKPVVLTVHVDAEGNIEDFDLPPLHIEGVTVYSDDPVVKQRYSRGIYSGTWERRYTLIAERPFTIPSFRIRYFDPEEERVETVASEPIAIEVRGGKPAGRGEETLRGVPKTVKESGMAWLYMNLAAAFLLGMGVMYLMMVWKNRRRKRERASSRAVGGEAGMLQRLMPHISESKEAAQMAENLYASLFEGKAVKVDKRAFEALMERLKRETGRGEP
jgi:hypothetical protein